MPVPEYPIYLGTMPQLRPWCSESIRHNRLYYCGLIYLTRPGRPFRFSTGRVERVC